MEPLDLQNDPNGPLDLSFPNGPGGGASVATQVAFNPAASSLPATNVQDAIDALAAVDVQLGTDVETLQTDLATLTDTVNDQKANVFPLNQKISYWTDFLTGGNSNTVDPFIAVLISSGTINTPNIAAANHPGMSRLRSAAGAGSGVFIGSNTAQLLLAGGEYYEVIFYLQTLTDITFRMGFLDTATSAAPTDGAYLEITATTGVATGHNANNGAITNTATTTTLSLATWYRAIVSIDAGGTGSHFEITLMDGTQVWTANLAGGLPTGAGRETGVGFIATTAGSSAVDLCTLDFMLFAYNGVAPVRG